MVLACLINTHAMIICTATDWKTAHMNTSNINTCEIADQTGKQRIDSANFESFWMQPDRKIAKVAVSV